VKTSSLCLIYQLNLFFFGICILRSRNITLIMEEVQSLQNIQSEGKDVQLFRVRMRDIFEKIVACIR
jgi:hypothetical protein